MGTKGSIFLYPCSEVLFLTLIINAVLSLQCSVLVSICEVIVIFNLCACTLIGQAWGTFAALRTNVAKRVHSSSSKFKGVFIRLLGQYRPYIHYRIKNVFSCRHNSTYQQTWEEGYDVRDDLMKMGQTLF